MATSRACTDSKGTGIWPLTRASCSIRQLTMASHLMATLKILSFPSPGIVTSKSTFRTERRKGSLSHSHSLVLLPHPLAPIPQTRHNSSLKSPGAHKNNNQTKPKPNQQSLQHKKPTALFPRMMLQCILTSQPVRKSFGSIF